ncbi:MAG: hypothetical protein MUD12_04625 [Spirochaetes bacterium]|jgi:hypothetical protein|nr:hypothetical protein [Spirochaetota bacterium]
MTSRLKEITGFIFAFFLVACLAGIINPANAEEKKMSVLDYYLALPDEYFYCETKPSISKSFKEKQIKKKNLRNGYILSKSEEYPMEVALFTDSYLMLDIIAVNVKCGEGCMCNRFALLSYSGNGRWSEMTANIFPKQEEIEKALKNKGAAYEYVLPEVGTTIRIVDSASKRQLLEIYFSGGYFLIKEGPAKK